MQVIDRQVCAPLYGEKYFGWKAIPAVNKGGGLLCIWNLNLFTMEEFVEGPGFLGLVGVWGTTQQGCVVVNIYSPCTREVKRITWDALKVWKGGRYVLAWCLADDFNAVCCDVEQRGSREVSNSQVSTIGYS